MCGCIPLPSWAGGNARDDAPPTRRQERERYAEELRRERGLSTDEEERRLEERLAELEAKHAEALRAGDAGRLADLEGAIADLERKLEVDAAAYTPEPRKSFIPSLGSIAVWKSTSASGAPDNWLWDAKALKNPPPTPGLNSSLKNTSQIQKFNLKCKAGF